MARAKRTDRAEARRRYRAEQAAVEAGEGGATAAVAGTPGKPAPTAARPPGISSAFRASFTPLDLRGDLAALPRLLVHRAFYIPAALTLAAAAIAIVTNQAPDATAGGGGDLLQLLSVFAFQYFVVAPPVGSAFIAGWLSPRASWLVGVFVGLVAVAATAAFLYLSPGAAPSPGEEDIRAAYLMNALAIAPLGAALFASAAAWYRRFLHLANPSRNQRPAPNQRGRSGSKGSSARR